MREEAAGGPGDAETKTEIIETVNAMILSTALLVRLRATALRMRTAFTVCLPLFGTSLATYSLKRAVDTSSRSYTRSASHFVEEACCRPS